MQAAWWVITRVERFQIRQPRVMLALMLLVVMFLQAAWWVRTLERFRIHQLRVMSVLLVVLLMQAA